MGIKATQALRASIKATCIFHAFIRRKRRTASHGTPSPWPRFYVRGNTFRSQYLACRMAQRKALATGTFVVIWRQDSPLTPAYEAGRVIPKQQQAEATL